MEPKEAERRVRAATLKAAQRLAGDKGPLPSERIPPQTVDGFDVARCSKCGAKIVWVEVYVGTHFTGTQSRIPLDAQRVRGYVADQGGTANETELLRVSHLTTCPRQSR